MAAYDAIRLSLSQGYLDWFIEEGNIPLLFVDNQSAIAVAKNSLITKRSKHMNLRFHTVRDYAKDLCYCPTDLNRADPLTKPLANRKYLSMFKPQEEPLDFDEPDSDEMIAEAFLCWAPGFGSAGDKPWEDLDPVVRNAFSRE